MPSYSSGEPVLFQKTGCFGPNPGPNKKSFARRNQMELAELQEVEETPVVELPLEFLDMVGGGGYAGTAL
jgi:hypothetical protein